MKQSIHSIQNNDRSSEASHYTLALDLLRSLKVLQDPLLDNLRQNDLADSRTLYSDTQAQLSSHVWEDGNIIWSLTRTYCVELYCAFNGSNLWLIDWTLMVPARSFSRREYDSDTLSPFPSPFGSVGVSSGLG
jgi:hypothetical protein